jgi:serine/threonine protein kinase
MSKTLSQVGGGNCSLCHSPNTLKSTCPLNPKATKPNPTKHPKATIKAKMPAISPPKAKTPSKPILIASGTYGCVYKPRLRCKNNTVETSVENLEKEGKSFVSKLCTKASCTEQQREVSSPAIKQADPTNKYHIGNPIMCTPNTLPKNCKVKMPGPKSLLIYEDGGMSLLQYNVLQHGSIKHTILPGFVNLFDGLAAFHAQDFHHRDIKPANITVGDDPSNKPNFRFIDFGFGITLDDPGSVLSWSQDQYNTYDHTYPYWPLDTYTFLPYTGRGLTIDRVSKWTASVRKTSYLIDFYMNGGLDGVKYTSQSNLNAELFNILTQLKEDEYEAELIDTAVRTTDIFSLGVSFLDSVYKEIQADTPLGKQLFDFIKDSNMLSINPLERPDAKTIASEYRTFIATLNL